MDIKKLNERLHQLLEFEEEPEWDEVPQKDFCVAILKVKDEGNGYTELVDKVEYETLEDAQFGFDEVKSEDDPTLMAFILERQEDGWHDVDTDELVEWED